MYWLVSCKDASYDLIGLTGCYDCMIKDTCTIINYHVHIRCTKKVWKPKMI